MQQTIIINQDYLKLVPRPDTFDYKVLEESILINGQREPIIINSKGTILDGHTRYDILINHGIDPKYIVKDFQSEEIEMAYVIECNLARRQLKPFQKIELTYSMTLILRGNYSRGGNTRNRKNTGGVSAIIGRTIGLNRNIVARGTWLLTHASPKILNQLRNGTITIDNAYGSLKNVKSLSSKKLILASSKLQCPHCMHELNKKDLIILDK